MPWQPNDAWIDGPLLSSFGITADNLCTLGKSMSRADERLICELAMAARSAVDAAGALYEGGIRTDEVLTLLSEELSIPHAQLHDAAQEINVARLRICEQLRHLFCRVTFAELFYLFSKEAVRPLFLQDFLPMESKLASVAFVKNAFADEAFDVFSLMRTDVRPVYVSSFTEAIDKLRKREVGYCLLPLEEQGGMRLPSVETLLYQNDVKIVAVTPVFGYDASAELTYALVALSFEPVHVDVGDDLYLEIALPKDGDSTLSDVLTAAQTLGVTIYRTDTVSYRMQDEKKTVFSLVFRHSGGNLAAFLCFLSLFVPEYSPIGFYKNLE